MPTQISLRRIFRLLCVGFILATIASIAVLSQVAHAEPRAYMELEVPKNIEIEEELLEQFEALSADELLTGRILEGGSGKTCYYAIVVCDEYGCYVLLVPVNCPKPGQPSNVRVVSIIDMDNLPEDTLVLPYNIDTTRAYFGSGGYVEGIENGMPVCIPLEFEPPSDEEDEQDTDDEDDDSDDDPGQRRPGLAVSLR